MKLDKITVQFTAEEIEAIHYAIQLGVRSFNKRPLAQARDWIIIADTIRKQLPTKLHLDERGR